jgi:hypothetical protein
MQQRTLGQQGLVVSALGLGTMGMTKQPQVIAPAARFAALPAATRDARLAANLAALKAGRFTLAWLGTGNAADELPMILQGCATGSSRRRPTARYLFAG